jgi:hypothetical protein
MKPETVDNLERSFFIFAFIGIVGGCTGILNVIFELININLPYLRELAGWIGYFGVTTTILTYIIIELIKR